MRQRCWERAALVTLLLVSSAARAEWRDWWWTQEQRAQQTLDAGRAAQAAPLFSDPARRAYAEIKSGQYKPAAERLAALKDPEAQYNRGNALARAGDLRGALAAYDAALARSAKGSVTERDARHNRELVARQLQQQQQQQDQEKQQQQKSSQQQSDESQQSSGQSSGQSSQGQGSDPKDPPSGENDSSGEQQAAEQKRQQGEEDSSAAKQDQQRSADNGQAKDLQSGEDRSREATEKGTEEQLQRAPRAANRDSPPTSERSLAVEQWLRQIPEDPGGLLRRKFLLEHRRKQREATP